MTEKFERQLRSRLLLLLVLILSSLEILSTVKAQCSSDKSRQQQQQQQQTNGQNKLAMYKITLRTYWSRARFPRHYPEWRPPAQFGKMIGRSHDANYVLYRLGERLSAGARQYVETGRTDNLDTGGDIGGGVGGSSSLNILHSFTGPAVPQGEGTSIAKAFLDGNHTLISVFARINPSPDWFVGVDSFQLCVEDNWVDLVTVELDPLDGGTDNGFTFTAANWPTQPQGIAYRITSRYPAHPAGSFYYPNLPRLPPIATLTFTKLREYTLTETYHEDDVEMEFISSENLLSNGVGSSSSRSSSSYLPPLPPPTPRGIDPNRDLNEAIAEERREMDTQRYRYWTPGNALDEESDYSMHPATRLSDNKSIPINNVVVVGGGGGGGGGMPVAAAAVAGMSYPSIDSSSNSSSREPLAPQPMTTTTKTTTIQPFSIRTKVVSDSKQFELQAAGGAVAASWPYYQATRTTTSNVPATGIGGGGSGVKKVYVGKAAVSKKLVNDTNGSRTTTTTTLYASMPRDKVIVAWKNLTNGNSIEHQRRYRTKHHQQFSYSKGKHMRNRAPRDCKVGEWGAWSACSRSCGIGETQRTRRIVIRPRRAGKSCPPLKETKWCGSPTPCPAASVAETPGDFLDSYRW